MGEHKGKNKMKKEALKSEGVSYVAYVNAIIAVRLITKDGTDPNGNVVHSSQVAAIAAAKQVRKLAAPIDQYVHIGQVAVMTTEEDAEQKKNIAERKAPWLLEEMSNKDENGNDRKPS